MKFVMALAFSIFFAGAAGAQEVDPSAFIGTWVGIWGRGMEHRLIVERVDGPKATYVYRAGANVHAEDISRARRHEGVIVNGVLYGKSPAGAEISYVLSADRGMLVGHYVRDGRNMRGEFKRQ